MVELTIGPGVPAGDFTYDKLLRAFPGCGVLNIFTSSCRQYPEDYTAILGDALRNASHIRLLKVEDLGEIEHENYTDGPHIWHSLACALPNMSQSLEALHVHHHFWQTTRDFEVVAMLSRLRELVLKDLPLESVEELQVMTKLTNLQKLDFGIVYDGQSETYGVPQALAALGSMHHLQHLRVPIWRRTLGGQAHLLAPALCSALVQMTQLVSLEVDGRFNFLGDVSQLTSLTHVSSATPVSKAGWAAFQALPNLVSLGSLSDLDDLPPSLPRANNYAGRIALLTSWQTLTSMELYIAHGDELHGLQRFKSLRKLGIHGHELPHEAQLKVLEDLLKGNSELQSFSCRGVMQVCRDRARQLGRSWPNLAHLLFKGQWVHYDLEGADMGEGDLEGGEVGDKEPDILEEFPLVREVTLVNENITASLGDFDRLPTELHSVCFHNVVVFSADKARSPLLPRAQLTRLELVNCWVDLEYLLSLLEALRQILRVFRLGGLTLILSEHSTEEWMNTFESLGDLTALEELHLGRSGSATAYSDVLQYLVAGVLQCNLPSLRALSLTAEGKKWLPEVYEHIMDTIPTYTELRQLTMTGVKSVEAAEKLMDHLPMCRMSLSVEEGG